MMSLGWGHVDGAFFFSRPDAAQQECCEPGFTLLCMGLFSRFFVQALPCTAEGTVCRVRDTRSLVPRAYGTNRSSSNTSCSRSARERTFLEVLALRLGDRFDREAESGLARSDRRTEFLRHPPTLARAPDAAQRAAVVAWCAADPGPMAALSKRRSRLCGAS